MAKENRVRGNRELSPALPKDTLKNMSAVIDDLLKTLITMSSALLGVGFIFDDFVSTAWVRLVIILLFFIGLVISFLGVLPFNVRYDIEDAEAIKKQEIKTIARKRSHLWWSAGVLALAFFFAIMDIFLDLIQKIK